MFNGKEFVIGDPHFGHKNIIKYCERPFECEDAMDEVLIHNWNSVVKNGHIVYINGDFSMRGKEETTKIISRLNGIKYLIRGNHDTKSNNYYRQCGFDEVSAFPIIYKDFYIISHKPCYMTPQMPYANIFAHVHNSSAYNDYSCNTFCSSVERINYTPIEINKAIEIMKGCV
jgi:calcineurin-like phosphoesterase family protein